MGRRDKLTKNYMRNPEKFADFFNGFIYDGQEVINWKDLQEVDPTSLINIPLVNSKKSLTVQKIRDIIKSAIVMKDGEKYLVLLGIENQSDVHYAMPVRTMLYNALTYAEQVELISKNRDNQNTDSATFLSGFTKSDRLKPVVTVTIYWGADSWDGPTSLKEMMEPMDDKIASLVDDCNINLFSIIDLDEVPEFRTRLRELFMLLSKRNNDVELIETVYKDAAFLKIDRETAEIMGEFTDIRLTKKDKEDQYNMCKAVEDIIAKGKAEGKAEGRVEGKAEGKIEGTIDTLVSLVRDGLLDIEEAAKRAKLNIKEFEEIVNSVDN